MFPLRRPSKTSSRVSPLSRSDRLFDQSEPRAGRRAANTAAGEGMGRGLARQGRGLGASEGARAATREPWRWGCSAQGTGIQGPE